LTPSRQTSTSSASSALTLATLCLTSARPPSYAASRRTLGVH
jgi:hypothetical protein